MIYYIDTNIFLRVLTADDKKKYQHCLFLLKQIKKNKIEAITGTVVLAEIVWSLGSFYGFSKEKIIRAVNSIINLRGLKIIDDYQHILSIDLYSKYNIKFINAVIASNKIIQERKCCVISYDKDFDKLPILKKEPRDLVK